MSLDVDWNGVKDYKELLDDKGVVNERAMTVVFTLMAIGIGQITPKNVQEVWRRVSVVQAVHANPYLTREDIARLVGVKTNVATESAAAFKRKMEKQALERVLRHATVVTLDPEKGVTP